MQVTVCAPSTSYEPFDSHQFIRTSLPVNSQFAGLDRWNSTLLSFDDFRRCQTTSRKLFPRRHSRAEKMLFGKTFTLGRRPSGFKCP